MNRRRPLRLRQAVVVLAALATMAAAACGQKEGVHLASGGGAAGSGSGNESLSSGDAGSTDQSGGASSGAATGAGGTAGAAAGAAAAGAAAGNRASGGTGGATATGGTGGSTSSGGGATGGSTTGGTASGNVDRTGVTDTGIAIGIHAPVSGAAPFPATSFQNGKSVYFDFINRTKGGINGRKVTVFFEDDGYNPSQAVSVCKKMVQQNRVFMLVGGGGADQIVACAQYANTVPLPYVAEGTSESALAKLNYYFAESMTYKQQSILLGSYIKNVVGKTKVSMVRADTANFEDGHAGFKQSVQQNGLTMVQDITIPKDAGPSEAQTAASKLCTHTNDADVVYPLMAPSIWINLAAAVNNQGCKPRWAGVGITMGLNIVAQAVCASGAIANDQASFFSPFPGLDMADQIDPDYSKAYKDPASNGPNSTPDDIGFALWGAEKLLSAQLAAAGKDLSRQSFVSSVNGKSFQTGVYPPVNYANSRFGGSAVHVLKIDCSKQQFVTESTFKSSFP